MIDAIKEVSCTKCLHQEVCRHKQDFIDICNAVSSSMVNRPCEDGKKVKTTPITNFDCLGGIQIECRYYQMQAINPRLFDPAITTYYGNTVTNPSTIEIKPSTIESNPYTITSNPDTLSNTISAIKKEN